MSAFSSSTTKRINNELNVLNELEAKQRAEAGETWKRSWYVGPKSSDGSEDIYTWEGAIMGPDTDDQGRPSPYNDRWITFTLTFPRTYPNSPPEVRFTTAREDKQILYHPSISLEGDPCADMLRLGGKHGSGGTYSQKMHIPEVLQLMFSMFKSPSSESPVNPTIQQQLAEDYDLFYKEAYRYGRTEEGTASASASAGVSSGGGGGGGGADAASSSSSSAAAAAADGTTTSSSSGQSAEGI